MHYHRPTGQKATTRAILKQELWLLGLTLIAALAETGLGFWIAYQSNSVALLGYSVESLLESAAAMIVGWRIVQQLRGVCDDVLQSSELFAERLVAASFLALGVYVGYESLTALVTGDHAEPTQWGIWLAVASFVVMGVLGLAKLRLAGPISSQAVLAEAKESLACSALSLVLLVGLSAQRWLGWWWADPVAATLIALWLIKEGATMLRHPVAHCKH